MDETKAGLLADLRAKRDHYNAVEGNDDSMEHLLEALDAFLDAPAPSQPTPEAHVEWEALRCPHDPGADDFHTCATCMREWLARRSAPTGHTPTMRIRDAVFGTPDATEAANRLAEECSHDSGGEGICAPCVAEALFLLDNANASDAAVERELAAAAPPPAPTPGYREGWEAGREAAALLFVEDAERFRAEADRALAMDLTVLAKMHMGDAAECLREAGRIRALPLPESALLTKSVPCERCNGTGYAPGFDADSRWPHNYACRECKGTGGVPGLQPLPEHLIEPAAPRNETYTEYVKRTTAAPAPVETRLNKEES